MATTKEDVLLEVADVRSGGSDGVLYVMNERIAWMTNNRVAASIHFSDIKSKVSVYCAGAFSLFVLLSVFLCGVFFGFVAKNNFWYVAFAISFFRAEKMENRGLGNGQAA